MLTCDIDLQQFARIGPKRIFQRGGNIAIEGPVPVSVLRSFPGQDAPTTPRDLARWINRVLGLKPGKGVGWRHPGINRLSQWVVRRLTHHPTRRIKQSELLGMARQWVGEYFEDVEIDPGTLQVRRRFKTIEVRAESPPPPPDTREYEAIELLEDSRPARRVRGLVMLGEIADPDLFDWCAACLGDESSDVRITALRTMLLCPDCDPAIIEPLAESADNLVRAAAIAALAKHSVGASPRWFERGLKDPSPHVRLETAAVLPRLDPGEHRGIFELALYDSNPKIVQLARRLTAHHKGYHRVM